MNKTTKIIIAAIVAMLIVLVVIYLLWNRNSKKPAAPVAANNSGQNPTTKNRPTPQPNWTDMDWLLAGYTQNEIDAAKALNNTLQNIPTFF